MSMMPRAAAWALGLAWLAVLGDLQRAQSIDKSVFEYWTHALAYVPTDDFRFFAAAMRRHHLDGDLPNCVDAVKKVCAAAEA